MRAALKFSGRVFMVMLMLREALHAQASQREKEQGDGICAFVSG
jgi:hypothetical protein